MDGKEDSSFSFSCTGGAGLQFVWIKWSRVAGKAPSVTRRHFFQKYTQCKKMKGENSGTKILPPRRARADSGFWEGGDVKEY